MKDVLSSKKEISATEKLLQAIRGESPPKDASPPSPLPEASAPLPRRRLSVRGGLLPFPTRTTLGIDLGHQQLRMILAAQTGERRWKLLAYRRVPLPTAPPGDSSELAEFLRAAVQDFAGTSKKLRLWGLISAAHVDVRHVRIPKVPRKQIYNAVYWTVKKETNFDEKETLFDFEIQGEVTEKGIPKIGVLAYTAPVSEIREARSLFSRSGLRLEGLSVAPFAVQNLFRTGWIPGGEGSVACLYIGNDFSRIDILLKGNLVFTRGMKAGISSMVESLREGWAESQPGTALRMENLEAMIPPAGESPSMDPDQARSILRAVLSGSAEEGITPDSFPVSEREVFRWIRPAVDRLVRQLERTFEHYTHTSGNESVQRILISGAVNPGKPLISLIGEKLGIESEEMDPLEQGVPFVGEVSTPSSMEERASFAAALGLALSDNSRTPNLLCTFKDKEEQASVVRINRGIFGVFLVAVTILMGYYLVQRNMVQSRKADIVRLEQQLNQAGLKVDPTLLAQAAARLKRQQQALRQRSRNLVGLALFAELSELTPGNIRLVSVTADLGGLADGKGKAPARGLLIDGIVRGDRQSMEASLARYIMKLSSCPLFENPTVHTSGFETFQEEGEVLHFVLKVGLA